MEVITQSGSVYEIRETPDGYLEGRRASHGDRFNALPVDDGWQPLASDKIIIGERMYFDDSVRTTTTKVVSVVL